MNPTTFSEAVRALALIVTGVALGMICIGCLLSAVDHRFDLDNTVYSFIALSLSQGIASYACLALAYKED